MHTLTFEELEQLLSGQTLPCISLYQTTHRSHPDNQQDSIRFKNLLKQIEGSLVKEYDNGLVDALLKQFRPLLDVRDFWNHTLDGLAVFCTPDLFRVFVLQQPVSEIAIVADSFHLKPIKNYLQTTDRFHVLCLSRDEIKLFQGNRNHLDEIDLPQTISDILDREVGRELTEPHLTVASYGGTRGNAPNVHGHGGKKDEVDKDTEKFFRIVDREITRHYSKPLGIPLILAALPEYHSVFKNISHNAMLIEGGIKINPKSLGADQLREDAWNAFQPGYLRRLEKLIADFKLASAKNSGTDNLKEASKAAAEGRIGMLLLEENRTDGGKIIDATGNIKMKELENPNVDDLYDDISELVLATGGTVTILPSDKMPSDTGLAAIFRY